VHHHIAKPEESGSGRNSDPDHRAAQEGAQYRRLPGRQQAIKRRDSRIVDGAAYDANETSASEFSTPVRYLRGARR